MVMKIGGDSDLDSCTSDSEDQDESESLFEGHARVIWTSLAETIEKIDDILVVDRGFLHGDIVASVSDPSGQTGTVTNVDILVDLKAPDGEIIRNVDTKKLVRVNAFEEGDYVICGSWLGIVVGIDQNVKVLFNDNAKCKIRRPDPESLVPISHNPFKDEEDQPYYPGQRVRATTSKVFKVAQWLQGKWNTGRSEGVISNVEVVSVYVDWIESALPSIDNQSVIVPEKHQDPKKLTLLPYFSYAYWQLGDWCLLPSNANLSGSLFVHGAATNGDLETVTEKDSLKSDLSSMTDALHKSEHCRRVAKHSSKVQKKDDDIEQALFVVNTRTKVDVLWQDGSNSFSLDSRSLFSVEYQAVQDFWPEQYVLEKGHDDDTVSSNARRIGVVKSVDSKERTVRVKWLKPKEHPRDLFEFDKEEVVSVYELDEHLDYAFCIGDVVRVSSFQGTRQNSGNVNSFLPNKECQSNLESEKDDVTVEQMRRDGILGMHNVKGGCTKELYLSCFGYIIGLKDGDIEVAWADGMVSKVGPQDISVIDYDDEDSSENSSEGNASEEQTNWDDDDVVSMETVDSHGVDNNGTTPLVDDSLLQVDTYTHAHHVIADMKHGNDVAESFKQSTIADTENGNDVAESFKKITTADTEHGNDVVESLNQSNGFVSSIPQAAFGFIARIARNLLGFQELKMLTHTPNSSFQEEPAEKDTLGNAVDDSVLAHGGKVRPRVLTPKDDLNNTDCTVDHQNGSVRENFNNLGVLTPNTVKNQEKEDGSLPDVYAHGNEDKCFKQFDIVNDPVDHFFLNKTSQSGSQREWIKKVQKEWTILENNLPDTIYVRVYEDRIDLLRAAIIGASGTPYQDGLYFFDIHLPSEYPHVPPSVHYHSCGLQLNPNLYEDGKLCLSLLNTWTGRGNEVWNPVKSSILQVLVSIQGLVLNEKPYFNEAGYDKQIGRAEAEKNSLAYNENSFLLSCKSMLNLLRKPPKHFESFVKEHFCKRGHYILAACNSYMKGAQVGSPSGEAVMPLNDKTNSQCSSSHGFKLMLAKVIPKLALAFREAGVDCDEFLQVNV